MESKDGKLKFKCELARGGRWGNGVHCAIVDGKEDKKMKSKNDLWDTIKAAYYQASNEFKEAIHKRNYDLVADPKLILSEVWEATKIHLTKP